MWSCLENNPATARERILNRCKSKTSTLQRGRPRKLTGRQGRLLLRCLAKLRDEDGNFTAQRLMFEEATKGGERIFIQDGDPSQNSAVAKRAMSRVQCRVINVPVRSPNMHCIENVFHVTSKKLKEEAKVKRITKESFGEFKKRVVTTIKAIPVGTIDELIGSTDKRSDAVITSRGRRIRY